MEHKYRILVTGGAGFIGSAYIRRLLSSKKDIEIYNIDKLSYASDLSAINKLDNSKKIHKHFKINLCNYEEIFSLLKSFKPKLIVNFAAESHVDRSLDTPKSFFENNVIGTLNLIEAARIYWDNLPDKEQKNFKFHHISTDEVFGSLNASGFFNESTKYDPRSPYSASKASTDHIINSWHNSYGFPTLLTNCSNNYGPYQFPEKLIPLSIIRASQNKDILIYGDGGNIRDWLFIEDHINALLLVQEKGLLGESYCIGGVAEKNNLEVAQEICEYLDKIRPKNKPHNRLIKFTKDRPGHDKRYSIDNYKIVKSLGWEPKYEFKKGIKITVDWYLKNENAMQELMKRSNYSGERLGLIQK